jgi:hypothetical protein
MNMKHRYDRKHTAMFFTVGDWVLLRLHCGYSIPSAPYSKLQQFVGPFQIMDRNGRLAYRFNTALVYPQYFLRRNAGAFSSLRH